MSSRPTRISAKRVRALLEGGGELALLDAREQGVHVQGHPFFASSLPLSRLELKVEALVPRRGAPLVVLDGGEEGLADKAAHNLAALGYTDVSVMEGGCAGWQEAGGELFRGVNVPSKAFGEFVEHTCGTPRIPPQVLKDHISARRKLVILDSRPFGEYHRMNIPGGIDAPGAELVWRVHDLAPDPDTLVVVNCAGRTRSIIGCQSLRNAGIPNEVVALKDGTMGWELAGFQCERGASRVAPEPGDAGRARALAASARVAQRYGVETIDAQRLSEYLTDETRTLYLLDVRTREEFEARRLKGSRHAPGGQLVQATDEYMAVRHARVVLVDPERVRAVMTASWLRQMGWDEVFVLDGFDHLETEAGRPVREIPGLRPWPAIKAQEPLPGTVLDLSTSLHFRARHVPGAWWGVRSRLAEAREKMGEVASLVLTSEDGVLAQLAAPEAQANWPQAEVRVLEGGNAAWFDAEFPTEIGLERATTKTDDVAYKPYDHTSGYEKHARDYLEWEVALVEQIKREPAVRFRTFG